VSPGLQVKHSIPNKKAEVDELRTLLRSPENQRDGSKYLQAVQKVMAYMTIGVDVSKLFSDMIMAGATANLVQKKLVYHYICTYAHSHSDLAVLTINTLTKDAGDQNPVVRGLALRSLCGLRIPTLVDYIREPLKAGLQDRSPYVRRMAVMGCVKLFYFAPELVSSLNLVDILYRMLRDKDPQVVCNCLATLNEILASEGGVVVNRNITHYLLNRLKEFNEWGQCSVMEVLMRYTPSDEEEMIDMLNVLDDRLSHANSGVVMGAVRLFLHLTQHSLDMHEDIHERVKNPLLTFLGSDSAELVYTCLQHMQMLLAKSPSLFQKEFKSFFCRYNDPPYLKLKKIEILTEIVCTETAKEVVEETGEYSTDVNVLVSRKSIEALGTMALKIPEHAQTCVVKLLSLLSLEVKHITSETLFAFTKILRNYESMLEVVLPSLPKSVEDDVTDRGKAAYIWILGEFGDLIPGSPYTLETMASRVAEEPSSVKLQLLTTGMKLFFKHPPECQETLGRLLEYAIGKEL
jgi:AP-4 complex subunit beta-1